MFKQAVFSACCLNGCEHTELHVRCFDFDVESHIRRSAALLHLHVSPFAKTANCFCPQRPDMWHIVILGVKSAPDWCDSHCHGWAWLLWAGLSFLRCRWACSTGWASGWRWWHQLARRAHRVPVPWTRPTGAHRQIHWADPTWRTEKISFVRNRLCAYRVQIWPLLFQGVFVLDNGFQVWKPVFNL